MFKRQWPFIPLSNQNISLLLHSYPAEYFQNFLYGFPHHHDMENHREDQFDIILLQHPGKPEEIIYMLRYFAVFSESRH